MSPHETFNISFWMSSLLGCLTFYPAKTWFFRKLDYICSHAVCEPKTIFSSRNESFCFRSFNVSRKIVSSAACQSTTFLHVSFSLPRNKVKHYIFSIRKIHKALKNVFPIWMVIYFSYIFLVHEKFTKWLTLKETSGSTWSTLWLQWDHPDQGAQAHSQLSSEDF